MGQSRKEKQQTWRVWISSKQNNCLDCYFPHSINGLKKFWQRVFKVMEWLPCWVTLASLWGAQASWPHEEGPLGSPHPTKSSQDKSGQTRSPLGLVLWLQAMGLLASSSNTWRDPWRPAIRFDPELHQSSQQQNVFLQAAWVKYKRALASIIGSVSVVD